MKTITNVALVMLTVAAVLSVTGPAMAQAAATPGITPPAVPRATAAFSGRPAGAGIGAGLVLIGAARGFGRVGGAALESMGRQPEVAGRIQTAMIIIAALLEGATFFALIVCITIPA